MSMCSCDCCRIDYSQVEKKLIAKMLINNSVKDMQYGSILFNNDFDTDTFDATIETFEFKATIKVTVDLRGKGS